jgi:hypothetical protein
MHVFVVYFVMLVGMYIILIYTIWGAVKKVPGILCHRWFRAPFVRTIWTACYWSFQHASFAEVAHCSSTNGRGSGCCIMITHKATHRLLCSNSTLRKHSCHHPTTVLCGSRTDWILAVPYSENGPQGDMFHNLGGHKSMWRPNSGRFEKKLSTGASNNGNINGGSACAQGSYFESY